MAITEILKAVSFAFPSIGYTQGMSFIAGFFSFFLTNEESFWMFVYLLEKRGMLPYFRDPMNLNRYVFIFDELMKKEMPKLSAHFVG